MILIKRRILPDVHAAGYQNRKRPVMLYVPNKAAGVHIG